MFIFFFVLVATVTVYSSQEVPKQAMICGEVPNSIRRCLGNPQLFPTGVAFNCTSKSAKTECEQLTCVCGNAGWLTKEGSIDKIATRRYFDEYGKSHPIWRTVVESVKSECLDIELPPQGIFVNCPAYDVVTCTMSKFFKNADPGAWQSGAGCDAARQFAELCPVCPHTCLAPNIPAGVCNACRVPPPSPK